MSNPWKRDLPCWEVRWHEVDKVGFLQDDFFMFNDAVQYAKGICEVYEISKISIKRITKLNFNGGYE